MFTYKQSSCELVVLDINGNMKNHIKRCLKDYKTRWNESLANVIGVVDRVSDLPKQAIVIIPDFIAYSVNPLHFNRLITVDDISNLTKEDLRRAVVKPKVKVTKNIEEASQWLHSLPNLFTYDCETTGLDVFNDDLTMYSFAIDEENAFVIINEDQAMEDMVLDFLINTDSTVVMHNASFDMKIVKYRTGKFIKHIEDTQLLAWTYLNHTFTPNAKVSLKHLAGNIYGDWAVKDLFGIEHKYNPELLHYSGVDACATYYVFNEYIWRDPKPEIVKFKDLLPIIEPRLFMPTQRYFYENVAKPMVPHAIDLMLNGINLDMDKVAKLDEVLVEVLAGVTDKLSKNRLIYEFQEKEYVVAKAKRTEELLSKKRNIQTYLKDYKHTDMVMRSYVVNTYLKVFEENGFTFGLEFWPEDVLANGDTKWSVNDIKKFGSNNALPLLDSIIDKSIAWNDDIVVKAMIRLARYKASIYNNSYDIKIGEIDRSILKPFNPGSPLQLRKFFEYMNIEPLAFSKTSGEASWGRAQLEEVLTTTEDYVFKDVLEALIDYSQSAIIKTTFIEGFKKYNVDGVLHGNFKLAGAKSFRPTSNKVNLLNLPSTGSIYAKPIKECFIPHYDNHIIFTADFGALESRVIANLTKDKNAISVFEDGLDSHCLNSYSYYKEEIEEALPLLPNETQTEYIKRYKQEVDEGNKMLKSIRQKSKGVSFKLNYLGFPDEQKGGAITQEIFDRYHNELYPGFTKFREDNITNVVKDAGYMHLGLGCTIRSDDIDKDIRTVNNAYCQFWSVLSLIAMCRMGEEIVKAGYEKDIVITASIYDSLYYSCSNDPIIVKWLNDTLIPIMTKPFIHNQLIANEAEAEIGNDWSDLHQIKNNVSIEEVEKALKDL